MATFYPFPRLPHELRVLVWLLAANPRTVQINPKHESRLTRDGKYSSEIASLVSPTPVPAALHACREGRRHNAYEKLFYSDQPERRYIWVNFDLDTLDVGTSPLACLEHSGSRIRRLRLERDYYCDSWFYDEAPRLAWFPNVLEYEVVYRGDLGAWSETYDQHPWSCTRERLKFINKDTGLTQSSVEVDKMVDDDRAVKSGLRETRV
jgi:hypothetical protein